jgi:hypothetical protein
MAIVLLNSSTIYNAGSTASNGTWGTNTYGALGTSSAICWYSGFANYGATPDAASNNTVQQVFVYTYTAPSAMTCNIYAGFDGHGWFYLNGVETSIAINNWNNTYSYTTVNLNAGTNVFYFLVSNGKYGGANPSGFNCLVTSSTNATLFFTNSAFTGWSVYLENQFYFNRNSLLSITMTNYQYKGIDINNIISGINSANRSTILTNLPKLNVTPQLNSEFTSASIINIERPANIGYQLNGIDISTYCIAKYIDYTSPGSYPLGALLGTTMATRMMAVIIGGGGGGGAGTSNTYTAAQNVHLHYVNRATDSHIVVYNNGYNSQYVFRGQNANLGNNVDITIRLANGYRFPAVQVRGFRGSGVNAVGKSRNLTNGDNVFGTVKYAIQQLFNQYGSPDNNFQNLTCNHGENLSSFGVSKNNGQFARAIMQGYIQPRLNPFDNQYQRTDQDQDVVAKNQGRAAGQAAQEGKFILLSSAVNQAFLNINVGSGAAGVQVHTGQTTAVAGEVSSITMGGVTYNSAQGASNVISIGASSTNQYSNALNNYGRGGGGGAPGPEGYSAGGQSGSGSTQGYVRVYLYYDKADPVFTSGDYTTLNPNAATSSDFPSMVQSIWNVPNFRISTVSSGQFISFNYTFYYSGESNIGTYKIIVDDIAYLFFNGTSPTISIWDGLNSGRIQLINGINTIQAIAYNIAGGVGFIASFFDSGSNLVAYTNNGWTSQILTSITPTAPSVHLPVLGGLWTTLYNNPQYYSKNGLNDINDINNVSYYYTNISNLSINSSKIVTSFTALSNISSTLSLNWGFKATGFIVVPISGRWTFALSTDDVSQLWIGTTTNTSGVAQAITPSLSSNILVAYLGGTVSYTVTLNTGVYFPILIYWGQNVGGQNFSLTITNPSSQVVTHSTIFHYVNAAPSY